jgi:signal peptidase II
MVAARLDTRRRTARQRLQCAGTLAGAVLIVDQLTKASIRIFVPLGGADREVIPGCLSLTHRLNPGIAFSFFRSVPYAPLIFSLVAFGAIGLIVWILVSSSRLSRPAVAGLGAIAGGAAGNLVDRIVPPHHVLDFIDCYVGRYHWPAFNVADSAICIGAGLLLLASLIDPQFLGARSAQPSSSAGPGSPQ